MTTLRALLACLVVLSFALPACSDEGNDETCSSSQCSVKFEDGKLHGELCENNGDCKYGYCVSSPLILGDSGLKMCTKLSCGVDCTCDVDDTDTVEYYRFSPGDPDNQYEFFKAFCLPYCTSVDDCKAIADVYTACKIPGNYGTTKYCVIEPTE